MIFSRMSLLISKIPLRISIFQKMLIYRPLISRYHHKTLLHEISPYWLIVTGRKSWKTKVKNNKKCNVPVLVEVSLVVFLVSLISRCASHPGSFPSLVRESAWMIASISNLTSNLHSTSKPLPSHSHIFLFSLFFSKLAFNVTTDGLYFQELTTRLAGPNDPLK